MSKKTPGAFRTISEVADELDVQQHVLRFWESKFTQVKPLKRAGGRRYYRPEDIELLKRIQSLLYTEGYTVKGVQKLLKGQGRNQIINSELGSNESETPTQTEPGPQIQTSQEDGLTPRQKSIIKSMIGELKDLSQYLRENAA